MSAGLLDFEDERTFVLRELEVYNWGPFAGKHRADIDERGTAIIGATGSGKTTLVDGLMTLLAENPRYNLASTGGHDKNDRSLLSYVRGVLGGDGGTVSDQVARPNKTLTGLCATYESDGRQVRIAGVFWTQGTSNSLQDLKRRWFLIEDPNINLDFLLQQFVDGGDRELKKLGRDKAGLRISESKRSYLASVRKYFDVSENAFNLLNRAAGLKQLDSVDAIFRELVLDDKSEFTRALKVADEFDNLAAIHKELEDARRQRDSLLPIQEGHRKLSKMQGKLDEARNLKQLAPRWYVHHGALLWQTEEERQQALLQSETQRYEDIETALKSARQQETIQQERYLALGGSDIKSLEKHLASQRQLLSEKSKRAAPYQVMARAFDLDDALSESTFLTNQNTIRAKKPKLEEELNQLEQSAFEARSKLDAREKKARELEATIRGVKANPSSNIGGEFLRFREELARHLAVTPEELPYLAELIEVKPEESVWRGAIERALGSNRLRILVPSSLIREALRWVNSRNNRLHARLYEARLDEPEHDFFHDSFIYKLTRKDHPLRPALENLLASNDWHCVSSAEELQEVEHGLTMEGMTSGRRRFFDKQDQRPLNDARDWLTGFDNKDQLKALARDLLEVQKERQALAPTAKQALTKRKDQEANLRLLVDILALDFAEIDSPGVEQEISHLNQRLQSLLAPDSDANAAKVRYDEARKEAESQQTTLTNSHGKLTLIERDLSSARNKISQCHEQLGNPLSEDEQALGRKYLRLPDDIAAAQLFDTERKTLLKIDEQIDARKDRLDQQGRSLVTLMGKARNLNEGAYVDVGADLEDIPHYLSELETIIKEALPEKQKRFLDYLNLSSDQGVTQLLANIDQQVTQIEERLFELNRTLAKVEFRDGRYLQLDPVKLKDERLRALENARRHLRSAQLKEDEGRSHFAALQAVVTILREAGNNRRLRGSLALLDPRYRLNFFVKEVDRETGKESARRSGSQSGSGGEKELMASHILTASLSYALCPVGANRPLYGTIVLDEAFSKSSQSAASRIVEALKVFGLHPIFVTPNKEIGLLKKHTRRAICVQRGAEGSNLATISWEKLAELKPHSPPPTQP